MPNNNTPEYVDLNSLGQDAIKAGIFFGAGLIPGGSFSDVPNYFINTPTTDQQASIVLTLQNIKDSLKSQLEQQTGTSDYSDTTIESFLYDFTSLLIDYSDIRNFIFFGSAYTEIAYNIKTLIDIYPYQTLISDLTSSFSNIQLINDNSKNQTEIIFSQSSIKDVGNFSFFDDNANFNVNDYELVDVNQKRYSILNAVLPYESNNIFQISDIQNNSNGIEITTFNTHNYQNGNIIQITDFNFTLLPNEQLNNVLNKSFIISNVTSNTFILIDQNNQTIPTVMNFVYINGGITRLYPLIANQEPYSFKILVDGILTENQLINYTSIIDGNNYTGFLISPTLSIINDFYFNLTPIQNILLSPSPINPTPWPTREQTNNLQNRMDQSNPSLNDPQFISWLQNSDLLYNPDETATDDDLAYYNNPLIEYRLVRALGLDETTTNQLIRRCIPYEIISELNDTPNGYFQRFILIAGYLFDQVRVYMQFIRYVHTLNYGSFNQLSPEYYKYYASYYGFELFQDDSIDFSELIIKTEPGLSYTADPSFNSQNKYYQSTLQALEYERQKRLLLSLFYLYKTKGTQACVKQLVSLLGAPDGLLVLNEYALQFTDVDQFGNIKVNDTSQQLIVDNEKVHVPLYNFEIDPDYLIDKQNISNPINQPYVYRMHLQNDSSVNLREISIQTNPNGAIDYQIINSFGQTKSDYIKLGKNEVCQLQNLNEDYYFLPLSFPDKFFGCSINYMIPKSGYRKGVGNNLEEVSIHLCSLYMVGAPMFKPSVQIISIVLQNNNTQALITTSSVIKFIAGEKVEITNVNGINNINNVTFTINSVPTVNSFVINGLFTGTYISNGMASGQSAALIKKGKGAQCPVPEVFPNYSNNIVALSDPSYIETYYNLLINNFATSDTTIYGANIPYIICRTEGHDLVIRLRLNSEVDSYNYERVAIQTNIFHEDGLNHVLRFIIREEGVEVYQDYVFVGLALWLDPTTSNAAIPFLAIEIPKKDILTCDPSPLPLQEMIDLQSDNRGLDRIRWWDLLIGYPQNIEVYFKKVSVFENIGIDSFNIGDSIVNDLNYNVDTYSFNFSNTTEDTSLNITTQCQFEQANPNIENADYGYLLPVSQNTNNELIVTNLNLSSRSIEESSEKYFPNMIQDFFNTDNIFRDFSWSKTLHKDYTYNNFDGKLINLYNLYSNTVLTYDQLSGFLNLIESKFKATIEQFIPIVINISEFGRLIVSSYFNQPKYRYTNIETDCVGYVNPSNSFIQSKIFATDQNNPVDGILINSPITVSIKNSNGTYLISPFTINYDESPQNTLSDIQTSLNILPQNMYYPNIQASIMGYVLRVEINYSWYQNTFSLDANTVTFIVSDGVNGSNISFSNGTLGNGDNNSCFSILRQLPRQEILDQQYIFFDSEHEPPLYIGYSFEDEEVYIS